MRLVVACSSARASSYGVELCYEDTAVLQLVSTVVDIVLLGSQSRNASLPFASSRILQPVLLTLTAHP